MKRRGFLKRLGLAVVTSAILTNEVFRWVEPIEISKNSIEKGIKEVFFGSRVRNSNITILTDIEGYKEFNKIMKEEGVR